MMRRIIPVSIVVLFVLSCFAPLLWTLLTSFRPPSELFQLYEEWRWFPSYLYCGNYRNVFSGRPFIAYLENSFIVATSTTALCLAIGSMAAFYLSRLRSRLGEAFLLLLLGASMCPQLSLVSPLFLMLRKLGLINTRVGLMIPYMTFSLPLAIWLLVSFFRQIPRELEEAARVDGCTRFQVFRYIVLPLARPALISTAILTFIFCWNEFLFALVFTIDTSSRTVPVGIALFSSRYEIPWGEVSAATIIVCLPVIIGIFVVARRIISGLTTGTVKG
jgi:multiple sugar transport system permease protein